MSPASYASLTVLYRDPGACFLLHDIFPMEIDFIASPSVIGFSSYLNSSVAFSPINFLPSSENTALPDFIVKLESLNLRSSSEKSILFLSLETLSFLFAGFRPL